MVFAASPARAQLVDEVRVSPSGAVTSIADALTKVRTGGRVIVEAGVYRESNIQLSRQVELVGVGRPTIAGDGEHELIIITGDSVVLHGFRLSHVKTSYVEDRAAVRARNAEACVISDNEFTDVFFGIYLAKSTNCRVERNTLRAANRTETTSGNGIHLWSSTGIEIANNTIAGFRDGLYFEFVHNASVTANISEENIRYGLHFMYSDDCLYERNSFRKNGSGVAVMYTHRVTMIGNNFESNWGAAAYGLLLKEISDARIQKNSFQRNTSGLVADGANRMQLESNTFIENGWAIRLNASTVDGAVTKNNFIRNTFDVATNSRIVSTTIAGNYWDSYRGYDLNRDGVGDVPFHPVRVFSMLVERTEPALILLRSAFVAILDATERILPVITPEALVDAKPSMRKLP